MPGPFCERCGTKVRLEPDGQTCSNCGRNLFTGEDPKTPRTHEILTQPKPDADKKPHHRYPVQSTRITTDGNSPARPPEPPPAVEEAKPSARRSRRSATK